MRTRNNKGQFQVERKPLYKNCMICSESFYCRSIFKYETGKYCSRKCLGSANSQSKKGKAPYKMTQSVRKKIQASKKGVAIWGGKRPEMDWVKGERSASWKGGITPFDVAERKRFRREMQKAVFERDNYSCQMCGEGGKLQVDHIQPWSEYVELRFSLDNCRTLCMDCHYFVTYGKRRPANVKAWGHNLERRQIS